MAGPSAVQEAQDGVQRAAWPRGRVHPSAPSGNACSVMRRASNNIYSGGRRMMEMWRARCPPTPPRPPRTAGRGDHSAQMRESSQELRVDALAVERRAERLQVWLQLLKQPTHLLLLTHGEHCAQREPRTRASGEGRGMRGGRRCWAYVSARRSWRRGHEATGRGTWRRLSLA